MEKSDFSDCTPEHPSVRLLLAEKHVDLIRSASGRKSFGVGIFKRARHKPRFLSGPLNVNSAIHWKRGEVFPWTPGAVLTEPTLSEMISEIKPAGYSSYHFPRVTLEPWLNGSVIARLGLR